ncbi:gene transfer agent family protein [Bosea sp. AS-1]|uniref:gene transfer agent family protein n=1 Tax=Bosea sp. AS-1 TaxID=2015316 RepID=UPI000B76BFBB|nr:gene transfer agent family protein [Bosea sp. AS-1]
MSGENRNGSISQDFGDGTYTFRLALGELEELQEKTDCGPFVVMQRLASNEWRTTDVRETLRLGLVGGGMPAADALKLVRRYVDDRPDWLKNALIARVVVQSALIGAPEEVPGKESAPEAETEV